MYKKTIFIKLTKSTIRKYINSRKNSFVKIYNKDLNMYTCKLLNEINLGCAFI